MRLSLFCLCSQFWTEYTECIFVISEKVIKGTTWLKCIWMTWTHTCCVSKPRHTLLGQYSWFAISISSLSTHYGMASSPSLPVPRIWQGHYVSKLKPWGWGETATALYSCRAIEGCFLNVLLLAWDWWWPSSVFWRIWKSIKVSWVSRNTQGMFYLL